MDKAALSLVYSTCPNDTFVFHAWAHGLVDGPPVAVSYADIDITNTAAERGEYDVVKVSYAALPWLLDRYNLLPSGGALGLICALCCLALHWDASPGCWSRRTCGRCCSGCTMRVRRWSSMPVDRIAVC